MVEIDAPSDSRRRSVVQLTLRVVVASTMALWSLAACGGPPRAPRARIEDGNVADRASSAEEPTAADPATIDDVSGARIERQADSTILISMAPGASIRDVFAPRASFRWRIELQCALSNAVMGIVLDRRLPGAQPVTFRWESDPPREIEGSASCHPPAWVQLEASHPLASLQIFYAGGRARGLIASMVEPTTPEASVTPIEVRPPRSVDTSIDDLFASGDAHRVQAIFLGPFDDLSFGDGLLMLASEDGLPPDPARSDADRRALEASLAEALVACRDERGDAWPRLYMRILPAGDTVFMAWSVPRHGRERARFDCLADYLERALPRDAVVVNPNAVRAAPRRL